MNDDDILTLDEAADLLKLNRRNLQNYCRRGDVPHQRFGAYYRFSRKMLTEHIQKPAQPTMIIRVGDKPRQAAPPKSNNPYCTPGILA